MMNMNRFPGVLLLSFPLLTGASLASCSDDDDKPSAAFEMDTEVVELAENGGEAQVRITTNSAWSVASQTDWCMVTPANGVGNAICTIKADSSYMYTQREGIVEFRTQQGTYSLRVTQGGYDRTIRFESLTDDTLHIPHYRELDKSYVDIVATANVPYQVEIPAEYQDWLSMDSNSDTNFKPETTIPRPHSFRVRFKTHVNSDGEREGYVIFKESGRANAIEKKVRVIQEAAPRIYSSRTGDSLAILTVARMLNAGVQWNTSRPITHWSNVVTRPITYDYYEDGKFIETRTEERVVSLRIALIQTKETLPAQIRHLDQLETLIVMSNANSYLLSIELGPEITELKHLKSLSLFGYGIAKLPEDMGKKMESLEELNLGANSFTKLSDVINPLKGMGKRLKYLHMNGCRISDGSSVKNLATIPASGIDPSTGRPVGLMDQVPSTLFTTFPELEYLNLSYNLLYGQLPELYPEQFDGGVIMPKLRYISVNLNRFSGDLPVWMQQHKYRGCWAADALIFTQEGKDRQGKTAQFSKESEKAFYNDMPDCPSEEEEEVVNALMKLPPLTNEEKTMNLPSLYGNWRSYARMY